MKRLLVGLIFLTILLLDIFVSINFVEAQEAHPPPDSKYFLSYIGRPTPGTLGYAEYKDIEEEIIRRGWLGLLEYPWPVVREYMKEVRLWEARKLRFPPLKPHPALKYHPKMYGPIARARQQECCEARDFCEQLGLQLRNLNLHIKGLRTVEYGLGEIGKLESDPFIAPIPYTGKEIAQEAFKKFGPGAGVEVSESRADILEKRRDKLCEVALKGKCWEVLKLYCKKGWIEPWTIPGPDQVLSWVEKVWRNK